MRKAAFPLFTCLIGLSLGVATSVLPLPRATDDFLTDKEPTGAPSKRVLTALESGPSPARAAPILKAQQNAVRSTSGRHFTLITGRVVKDGQAYPNCQMFLEDIENPVPLGFSVKKSASVFDRTDEEGRFLFAVTHGGRYLLGAVKNEGSSPFKFKQILAIKNVENSVKELGDIDVTQAQPIYGQVTDSSGHGLPSVSVIARIDKKVVLRTLTGCDGSYRLGFIERKKDVELLFIPRPPFKGYLHSARIFVKRHESIVDRVLEEKENKSFSQYVFVYTRLNRPKDPEFDRGPAVHLFQAGQYLTTITMGLKEGLYNAIFELDPGEYLFCIQQGNTLRIGKTVRVTGEEFQSFELTEYDVIPTRKLALEFNLVEKRPIDKGDNYLRVGFFCKKSSPLDNPSPKFLMNLFGTYNEIEIPMNMALKLKHRSIDVNLKESKIKANQEGLIKVEGYQD